MSISNGCQSLIANMCGDRSLYFSSECATDLDVDICGENELYAPECEAEEKQCLSLMVLADHNPASAGDELIVIFAMENKCDTTIDSISMLWVETDRELVSGRTLEPGKVSGSTPLYVVTEDDAVRGSVTFTAEANGLMNGIPVSATASHTIRIV